MHISNTSTLLTNRFYQVRQFAKIILDENIWVDSIKWWNDRGVLEIREDRWTIVAEPLRDDYFSISIYSLFPYDPGHHSYRKLRPIQLINIIEKYLLGKKSFSDLPGAPHIDMSGGW